MNSLAQTTGPPLGGSLYTRLGSGTYRGGAALGLAALDVLVSSPRPDAPAAEAAD